MNPPGPPPAGRAPAAPARASEVDFVLRQLDKWVERGLGKLEGRGPEPLKELHLELTHRCNLRCVMCHHWELPYKDRGSVARELDLAELRRFVDASKLLDGIEIVVLTGGEPWLKRDIAEIVEYLAGRFPKARVGVLTNFWNTEMLRFHLGRLRERGVKNLWLGSSLDGLEATHDRVRGRPGAFKGLLETVEFVRREHPEIPFSFSFTVTPLNYRELWDAYRFVGKELGLWFGAQIVVNHQGFEAPGGTFHWTEEQLAEVEGQIDRILLDLCRGERAMRRLLDGKQREALWLWNRLLYWRYLRRYSRAPARFFKDCLAGQRYAMFDPEGNLFFCPVNKHRTIGNVRERPFDELWRSKEAKAERGYVESCRCDCWLNCIANPILDRALDEGVS